MKDSSVRPSEVKAFILSLEVRFEACSLTPPGGETWTLRTGKRHFSGQAALNY